MESRINYTVVGLFVVLLATGLVYFLYWLGKYGSEQEYTLYKVYMSESVAGLSPDASVKYRGVNVGTVSKISLRKDNPEQVELLLKIKFGVPIKQDTTATLKLFGLTGLAYIELSGGSKEAPLLVSQDDQIPVIPSQPSIFARIDESVTDITGKAVLAMDKFTRLLNDNNLKNFEETLAETNLMIKEIRRQLPAFKRLVDNGVKMELRVTSAFDKVARASDSVKMMSDKLNSNYGDLGEELGQELSQSLVAFNQLMHQLTFLATDLQRTVDTFEHSPGDLLYKRSQIKPGPGEQ
jgi:phospholipid/cholesterol/gamma-HCH transport system substrate-binding protein